MACSSLATRAAIGCGLLLCLFSLPGCGAGKRARDARARPLLRGRVLITSQPSGAAVLTPTAERLGKTPLTLERPVATWLELELVKDGYEIHRSRVFVEEGRTQHVRSVLRRLEGTLIVRSGLVRGATITVDGEEQGKTPSRVQVAADLQHLLVVSKPGFETSSQRVTVSAGETREIDADMVAAGAKRGPTGWLTVLTDSPAVIYLDGLFFGQAPLTRVPLPARGGGYRLTVKSPARGVSRTLRVKIEAGQTRTVKLDLRGEAVRPDPSHPR